MGHVNMLLIYAHSKYAGRKVITVALLFNPNLEHSVNENIHWCSNFHYHALDLWLRSAKHALLTAVPDVSHLLKCDFWLFWKHRMSLMLRIVHLYFTSPLRLSIVTCSWSSQATLGHTALVVFMRCPSWSWSTVGVCCCHIINCSYPIKHFVVTHNKTQGKFIHIFHTFHQKNSSNLAV
jgi:hypothetical protein